MSHTDELDRTYLGDGVYARRDGENVVLTTEDGYRVTNEIFLEPEVWKRLKEWVER